MTEDFAAISEAVTDIRQRLQQGDYKNEEHVRLCLVARLLQELGWNIWDPVEVNAEYQVVPNEDATRVDFALFAYFHSPSVYVEVKNVGGVRNLAAAETQLRDYNRNNTAPFCVITDGRTWHLYYSQTGGEFANKRFKTIDVLNQDVQDICRTLCAFLDKVQVTNGQAQDKAQSLLRLTRKQRAMEKNLPEARRRTGKPPFPTLPEALVNLVALEGFGIAESEAKDFIQSFEPPPVPPLPPPPPQEQGRTPVIQDSANPPSLKFTSVHRAVFGTQETRNWNGLVRIGVSLAVQHGRTFEQLRGLLGGHIEQGTVSDRGFQPLESTGISVRGLDANNAWDAALKLAKELRVPIEVSFSWRQRDGAAFPGQSRVLRWRPD
jgi:hypothetical protein